MATQSTTGEAVKILSLDEVAEIEREPWMHSYGDDREEAPLETRRVAITVGQRDALCATVRALEVECKTLKRSAANERLNNRHLWEANKNVVATNTELKSQLAAVTEERDAIATAISAARAEVWKEGIAIAKAEARHAGCDNEGWKDKDGDSRYDCNYDKAVFSVVEALEAAASEGVKQMNYDGLAELGWRGTRTVRGLNGYYDWEKLTDVEQQVLARDWYQLPASAKLYLRDAVVAAIDAYQSAVLL